MLQSSHIAHIPCLAEQLINSDSISIEHQYHQAMVEMRQRNLSSFSAESKMPFALKQRLIEIPMLEHTVSKALSSPAWRQAIVKELLENIENGPGHFSVHRAKDAIKQIANSIGLTKLAPMLHSAQTIEAAQAAHLLGWLKNSRAAFHLIDALRRNHSQKSLIQSVVAQHYPDYLDSTAS